jgi:hypothetical protein
VTAVIASLERSGRRSNPVLRGPSPSASCLLDCVGAARLAMTQTACVPSLSRGSLCSQRSAAPVLHVGAGYALFSFPPLKMRGDGAPVGATLTKGASRRAVRRLYGRRGALSLGDSVPRRQRAPRGLARSGLCRAWSRRRPSADLLVLPAGAGPIHTNGATGSRPLDGSDCACILSYRNDVKTRRRKIIAAPVNGHHGDRGRGRSDERQARPPEASHGLRETGKSDLANRRKPSK